MGSKPVLTVLGLPLSDEAPISNEAKQAITAADLVIGESRKRALGILAQAPEGRGKNLYLLDESSRPEDKEWKSELARVAALKGKVVLFSDTGMPLLFDPGQDVLEACKNLGFEVRASSGPTSWGSAAALSGWLPPFLIVGFPPRQNRAAFWKGFSHSHAHCVLMERPYSFLVFLKECVEVFGKSREAFLAWEIDSEKQRLLWGSLGELERLAQTFESKKGEYVLVVKGLAQ
jgi:16S rRNA C1402 (ribose-2'-O) methylase RsmI